MYLPATHSTHVPPLKPDEPALHEQSSAESLPDSEFAYAGQLEHVESDVSPDVIEYLPAAHSVQLLDEAEENDPAEHERQVEAAEAPVSAEYVPASQVVQQVEAVPAAYLPAKQRVQADAAAAEYVPAAQMVQVEAISAENVPATQLVQTVEATDAEYLPAPQLVQTLIVCFATSVAL